jgi:hypothetical protein
MSRLLACVMLLGIPGFAAADEAPRDLVVTQPSADDLYGAGPRVEIRAAVNGDVVVAGQTVVIAAPVTQDITAAGERVLIDAPAGDDVRVAGREVRIGSAVGGHLVAAGEEVTLLPGARVARFARLFGRNLTLDGEIGGDLKITAESVRIAGRVRGNAEIHARRLELLPEARIDGDLLWSGVERQLAPGQVGGKVIVKPRPPEREHHLARVIAGVSALFILALALAGVALFLLFPRAAERLSATVRQRPWGTAGLGLAVLLLTPVVVVLLFASVIGWLLALILLALWLAALPVSGLAGTYALADRLFGWHRRQPGHAVRAGLFLLAIVVVGLLHLVPILGWLLGLWLMLWGLGAMALGLRRRNA